MILMELLKWLDWIDYYWVFVMWVLNFVFGLVIDFVEEIKDKKWDLFLMWYMFNGGEVMVVKVGCRIFEFLELYGLFVDVIWFVWGMFEILLGVIFFYEFIWVGISDDDYFVEIGFLIFGFFMRIVNDYNELVEEGEIGCF